MLSAAKHLSVDSPKISVLFAEMLHFVQHDMAFFAMTYPYQRHCGQLLRPYFTMTYLPGGIAGERESF